MIATPPAQSSIYSAPRKRHLPKSITTPYSLFAFHADLAIRTCWLHAGVIDRSLRSTSHSLFNIPATNLSASSALTTSSHDFTPAAYFLAASITPQTGREKRFGKITFMASGARSLPQWRSLHNSSKFCQWHMGSTTIPIILGLKFLLQHFCHF